MVMSAQNFAEVFLWLCVSIFPDHFYRGVLGPKFSRNHGLWRSTSWYNFDLMPKKAKIYWNFFLLIVLLDLFYFILKSIHTVGKLCKNWSIPTFLIKARRFSLLLLSSLTCVLIYSLSRIESIHKFKNFTTTKNKRYILFSISTIYLFDV